MNAWNMKKDCALFHVKQNLTMSYPVFLLPQTIPACISCSMRGASVVDTQEEGWAVAYRKRARTTAELLTVQPMISDASWLSRCKVRSFSSVRVWVRMKSDFLRGVGFRVAI